MIPSDLASRLRMLIDAEVQALAPVHQITEDLPDLATGQRFSALIQSPLPDGSFRALVAGRSVTLSLPNAAKSGDALELVVTGQQDQRVTARLAADSIPPGRSSAASASTPRLSAAGQLISQLLTGRQSSDTTTALNAGAPLMSAPPTQAASLVPVLQQALSQSGLFYESHQAQWVGGERTLSTLMAEPQAQQPALSAPQTRTPNAAAPNPAAMQPPSLPDTATEPLVYSAQGTTSASWQATSSPANLAANLALAVTPPPTEDAAPPAAPLAASLLDTLEQGDALMPAPAPAGERAAPHLNATQAGQQSGQQSNSGDTPDDPGASHMLREQAGKNAAPLVSPRAGSEQGLDPSQDANATPSAGALKIAAELMPLVHRQLDTLATHQAVWQGQVWPGQTMQWEIFDPESEENTSHQGQSDQEEPAAWQSTLRLQMPVLGNIRAQLFVTPAGVAIRISADSASAVNSLQAGSSALADSLDAAGVSLTGMVVQYEADA